MKQPLSPAAIRERHKRRRLAAWILFYLLIVAVFAFVVYWQARQVNTLGFAGGTLQLATDKTKYTVGDTINYTLKNGLSQPIALVSNCPQEPLFVYSWTNNTWVRIHDTAASSACKGQPGQRTVAAGASYTGSFASWPNLFSKPGIYRIVELATNYTALPYADFQVVAKPVPAPVQVQVQTQTQIIIQKVITPVYITVPSSGGDSGGDN